MLRPKRQIRRPLQPRQGHPTGREKKTLENISPMATSRPTVRTSISVRPLIRTVQSLPSSELWNVLTESDFTDFPFCKCLYKNSLLTEQYNSPRRVVHKKRVTPVVPISRKEFLIEDSSDDELCNGVFHI
eukprot:PhF_6_TR6928/c0_g1_i1/m.10117